MLAVVVSTLPKPVEEVGAIAGIASFVLMLALLGLYIVRAIELRRLRKTMPFLVNPENGGPPDAGSGSGRSGL